MISPFHPSRMWAYAGGNKMIAAPQSGQVAHRQGTYSANVAFGRV